MEYGFKKTYYIAAFIGSIIGAYIPKLWGTSSISFSSVLLSGIGGLVGILIAWRLLR